MNIFSSFLRCYKMSSLKLNKNTINSKWKLDTKFKISFATNYPSTSLL